MSRWPGRLISKTPVTPGGPAPTAAAPGVWTLPEQAYWQKQGLWPDASADPYWGYVSFLMSTSALSNANNNLFVDSSGAFNPISRNGNTTQGAQTPYGSLWSNYFDGSSYIYAASGTAQGTGDFTVEGWFNISSYSTGPGLYDTRPSYTNGAYVAVFVNTSGVLSYYVNTADQIIGGTTVTLNTWNHFAVCRSGTSTKLFLNGVQQGSTYTDTNNYQMGGSRPIIGGNGYVPNGASQMTGYISNIRAVNGTALYTANFTPSASPLTAISGTTLLTCQSNRFKDNSTSNVVITAGGTPRVTAFSPFILAAPGAVYNQSDVSYWSGYFDGSSYITMSSGTAAGTGDFTVEGWFNLSSYSTEPMLYDTRPNSTNGAYPAVFVSTSGYLSYYVNTAVQIQGATAVSFNTWNHFAVCRSGTSTRLFLNGVQQGSTYTDTNNYQMGASRPIVGGNGYIPGGASQLTGYVSNLRVVNGTALYTTAFTPPTSPLTAISGTVLLTCQNAAFTDNSTNKAIITPNGNTIVTGNNPFQAGYYSNYFDGSGDYLRSSLDGVNIRNAAFTIEGWVNLTTASGFIFFSGSQTAGSAGQALYLNEGGGTVYFGDGVINNITFATSLLPVKSWAHIACTFDGTTYRIFVNGTSVGSSTTLLQNYTLNGIDVGGRTVGATVYMTGYASNFRVIKGSALYTSAFTPPTAPLTAISGTSLLTCQGARFLDSSANAYTVTPFGNTTIQTYNPFYTSTVASNGGSMYFDGTGDYLTVPSTDLLRVDQADWTIEAWVYLNTTATNHTFINRGVYLSTYSFYFGTSGTSLYYEAGTGGWSATPYTSSSGAIAAGQWNHVAAVRSGTSLLMYANGVRVLNQASASFGANVNAPALVGSYLGGTAVLNGYMNGLRFTQGTALYTGASYTVPTSQFAPSANTALLLNGMNAGVFDAAMKQDMETVGNAQVSSAQAKYGTTSVAFDGTGDQLLGQTNPNLAFGTGDFTIEAWVYQTQRNTLSDITSCHNYGVAADWLWSINSSGYLFFQISSSGTGAQTSSSTVPLNTWTHVAVSRQNGVVKQFIAGTQVSSATYSTSVANTIRLSIGSASNLNAASTFYGYIDDLRITNGVARYTGNFTPPTAALPVY